MIVLDASAALDLMLSRRAAAEIGAILAEHTEVHVPEHFHVECISGLRRLRLSGGLPERAAQRALVALERLRAVRYPIMPVAAEIWSLRDRLSAYDAAYLALAATLDLALLTTDEGLAGEARKHGRFAGLQPRRGGSQSGRMRRS